MNLIKRIKRAWKAFVHTTKEYDTSGWLHLQSVYINHLGKVEFVGMGNNVKCVVKEDPSRNFLRIVDLRFELEPQDIDVIDRYFFIERHFGG